LTSAELDYLIAEFEAGLPKNRRNHPAPALAEWVPSCWIVARSGALPGVCTRLSGWRSTPGTIAQTSQLAWLISLRAINLLSWSRTASDLLSAAAWGISSVFLQRRSCFRLAVRPYHLVLRVHGSPGQPSERPPLRATVQGAAMTVAVHPWRVGNAGGN
jgi:hypothetical protein